jgi:hypothetical protein
MKKGVERLERERGIKHREPKKNTITTPPPKLTIQTHALLFCFVFLGGKVSISRGE